MTGPLLKSARLTHYHAAGAVGHPVYLAATQLRAAIARRLGQDVADVFAVPQRNEDGDTVDWYAPNPGTVVPWRSATESERTEAQQRLMDVRDQIETLGRSMEAEASPERQVFGRLLAQVMQFPDEQDVHLVDGSPVLTFWGFVRDRATVGSDPLRDLDRHIASPEALPVVNAKRRWWLWPLLVLLALLLLAALLWMLHERDHTENGPRETPPSTAGTEERRLKAGPSAPDSTAVGDANLSESAVALPEPSPEVERIPPDQTGIDRTLIDGVDRRIRIHQDGDRLVIDDDAVAIDRGDGPVAATGSDRIDRSQIDSDLVDPDVIEPATDGDAIADTEEEVATALDTETPLADAVAASESTDAEGVAVEGDATAVTSDAGAAADAASPADAAEADGSREATAADVGADATETGGAPAAPASDGTPDADAPQEDSSTETDKTAVDADATAAPGAEGDALPAEGPGPTSGGTPGTDVMAAAAGPATGAAPAAIPPQQLLNSGWRTSTTLQDPKDGSPVKLDYRLRDGAGKVRLTRKDGSVCESDAQGTVRNGRLVVDSARAIVCADGTSFGQPQIDCAPRQDGKAQCIGRYSDGSTFPIDMERRGD